MKTTKELFDVGGRLRTSLRRLAERAILELQMEYQDWLEECRLAYRVARGIRKAQPDPAEEEETRYDRQLKAAKHHERLALRRKG